MTSRDQTARMGGVVMAWTVFTTTFLWTPALRGLFRPDNSTWSVLGIEGTGRAGSFWVFPALARSSLLAFYLDGRNRLRSLVHAFLLAWHGPLAFIAVAGIAQGGAGSFEGAMWDVNVHLTVLAVPFTGFLALTIVWIVRERGAGRAPDARPWRSIDLRSMALGVVLFPVAIALFGVGEGIDWPTRLGTAATIFQWILFTQAMSDPRPRPSNTPTPVSA
ncbi:MAG: hypothetical protein ACFCVC_16210 [Acidimicrobiia bacterium]